jgi:hypothetical protein
MECCQQYENTEQNANRLFESMYFKHLNPLYRTRLLLAKNPAGMVNDLCVKTPTAVAQLLLRCRLSD